jgi:1,2-diacylglycerol 3-alpha-glucosyltransferase
MYDQYIYYIAPRIFLKAATKFSHQYERFIARNATELTGPSQKCSEYFKKIGVKKELNLIPNSADLESFNPDTVTSGQIAAVRERYNIPEDRMVACFVGRLGQEKSVDVLLEYWAKTVSPEDGLHLMIVGDGPDKKALELLAEGLGIADTVTFTGLVRHDDMPAYFCMCDLYATASLSEMNSISMLEGMATGLTVLQRYDELNADQIQQGENGFLYTTMEEFGAKLRELRALSPEELAQRKARVSQSVISRGSTELAGYMLGVYEKAIREKANNPSRFPRIRITR